MCDVSSSTVTTFRFKTVLFKQTQASTEFDMYSFLKVAQCDMCKIKAQGKKKYENCPTPNISSYVGFCLEFNTLILQ